MDYHLHTSVTIDGRMTEYLACERASALGLSEIAFTNHVMLNQVDYTMSAGALVDHWAKIQQCQIRFPELKIRLGIEMDYYPGREDEIASTLRSYESQVGQPFDLVLGSVHEINGGFFSSKHVAAGFFKDRDLVSLYHAYFQVATQAARSGLFDVIAHPDLIKKYTHELTLPLAFDIYRPSVEPFIDVLVSSGVGLEVNTKGLKLSVKEAYPSVDLLKLYLEKSHNLGVHPVITLGSDAHRTEEVGFQIPETINWLSGLGITSLSGFDQRHSFPLAIGVRQHESSL